MKQKDDKIKDINELLRAILESSSEIIVFALDTEYRYLAFNNRHKETMQAIWGKEIKIGMCMLDAIGRADDRKKAKVNFDRTLAGESFTVLEEYGDEKLSRLIWQDSWSPILSNSGAVVGLTCFLINITERVRVEEALKESEENIRILLDSTYEAIYGIDTNGNCTFCNASCIRLLGYKNKDELVGKNMHLQIHHSNSDGMSLAVDKCKIFEAFVKGEGSHVDNEVFWRADGTSFPIEYFSYPQLRDKKIIGAVVTFMDITERKQIENALLFMSECGYSEPREDFFRSLARYLSKTLGMDYVCIAHLKDDYVSAETVASYIDGNYENNVSYTLNNSLYKKVVGKRIGAFPADTRELFPKNAVLQEMLPESYIGTTLLNSRGEPIGLISTINRKPLPNRKLAELILEVVSVRAAGELERKKSEEALKNSEEKYRLLITRMKQGLAVFEGIYDGAGRLIDYLFVDANESFEMIIGLNQKSIVGKTLLELLPNTEKNWMEKLDYVVSTGESLQYEKYSKSLGKYLEVISYSPQIGQIAVIITDITNRKKMEKQIYNEKERYKTTLVSVGDGVISTDQYGNVELLNKVAEQLTGWTQEEAFGKPFEEVFNIVNEYTRERCENPVDNVIKIGKIIELANHTILISKEGIERPIEDSAAPIRDEDGNVNGVVLVFRDFTEKKERQDRIEYLSFHDQLTGLYNRRFFEEEIIKLDTERHLPFTLVMADVNGLKLSNDAFGHSFGDKLLRKIADIIKSECRKDDIVARVGGDEFVILLPRTNSETAEQIIQRIIKKNSKEKVDNIVLSVSFGWDTKIEVSEKMSAVFKKAEDNMYRRKLSESSDTRIKILNVIMKTLYKNNIKEKQHSEGVSKLCEAIGAALSLNTDDVNDLRIAGLMHDVGKVGVEEQILNKEGSLSEFEWAEVRKHSETGYHILRATNEFARIAEYVLAHHERWDGNGYPKKLKGEEIPRFARIIAVADAFDAMINERPYRKALSQEAAVDQLRINSGSQFDPDIVEVFINKVLKKS